MTHVPSNLTMSLSMMGSTCLSHCQTNIGFWCTVLSFYTSMCQVVCKLKQRVQFAAFYDPFSLIGLSTTIHETPPPFDFQYMIAVESTDDLLNKISILFLLMVGQLTLD
jgi:hypothetical protein